MSHDERLPHPKDRVPPEEGVIIPKDDLELIADDAPTEHVDPVVHDGDVLDKRPTDGPL